MWLTLDDYYALFYILYADGITLDGTILNITHSFELGLVIVFDILATMGLIFTIVCLMFNIIFRKRKLVKLFKNSELMFLYLYNRIVKISSPSLNYFIILGASIMYSSIYFFLLPSLNHVVVLTGCLVSTNMTRYYIPQFTCIVNCYQLELWLFTVGYLLAFGAVLAKMWRIYQIFSNPKPKKRVSSYIQMTT